MPETTENYRRVPNPKHTESDDNAEIRTITISDKEGIKALYCVIHKKVKTFLFDKDRWTMESAKKWVDDHSKMEEVFDAEMLITKGFVEEKAENPEGYLDVSVASAGIVDRDGEIIDQDGWDLKNFKKNPQLLWAHNIREVRPPIGKVTKIWFDGDGRGKTMKFKAMFDMADAFAAEIYRKLKEGFLNAFSVGFMPIERDGNTYTKTELLEISVVPVPSNPAALVEIRSKGIEPMEWKDLLKHEDIKRDEEEDKEETKQPEEEKVDIKELVREVLNEVRMERHSKNLEAVSDALRVIHQAVEIALKNIRDTKGGE